MVTSGNYRDIQVQDNIQKTGMEMKHGTQHNLAVLVQRKVVLIFKACHFSMQQNHLQKRVATYL